MAGSIVFQRKLAPSSGSTTALCFPETWSIGAELRCLANGWGQYEPRRHKRSGPYSNQLARRWFHLIQIFTADGKTGVLQHVSIFSVGAGKAPAALALAPNGNFLYSLNRGTNDI